MKDFLKETMPSGFEGIEVGLDISYLEIYQARKNGVYLKDGNSLTEDNLCVLSLAEKK